MKRQNTLLTVFWWQKRSSRVGSSCWHSLEETDTFRQTSMSTSKRMKLRKRRKTKVSLSEFGVTCHTAQHCLNALSFSLYGPLSFCRQIKAKENKSNFQKSIGERKLTSLSHAHTHQSTSLVLHYHVYSITSIHLYAPFITSCLLPFVVKIMIMIMIE